MKKQLLYSALLLITGSALMVAQPVITATGVNPVIGDHYTLNYTNYLSPGNPGASQTYNLSGMVVSSTVNYSVGTVASAPNSSPFTSNSNLQMNNDTIYSFINVTSTAYQNSGSLTPPPGGMGSSLAISYSNNEDILHYPFSMNNNFSDTWSGSFSTTGITFLRTGTTTVTYDGYGTLVLPTMSVTSVARLHVVQNYMDTYSYASSTYTNTYVNDEYIWMNNSYHQPIAGVTILSVAPSGTASYTVQSGFYADVTGALPTSIKNWSAYPASLLSCFPNPASGSVNFAFNSDAGVQTIHLFDQYGRLVRSETADPALNGNNLITLKLDELASGIYTAKISGRSGAVETQKITVVK